MKNKMKTRLGNHENVIARCVFCSVVGLGPVVAFADRGRGSIRAAAPREAVHEEPARAPMNARAPVHVEPARVAPHVEVQAHRDWDDNDEDARHFGGFGPGVPAHIDRGARFRVLPPRNIRLHFGALDYFLDEAGAYYQEQADGEYVVIQPPIGITVAAVPLGATAVVLGPTTYDYLDGVFYINQNNAFVVVNPPPGIVVPSLPSGANQVVINGNVVYQFNGFNYQPSIQDGVTVYTVNPA